MSKEEGAVQSCTMQAVRNRRNATASAGFIFTCVGQVENGVLYALGPNKGEKTEKINVLNLLGTQKYCWSKGRHAASFVTD